MLNEALFTLIIFGEVPNYVVFSSLLPIPPSYVQIFSSAPSVCTFISDMDHVSHPYKELEKLPFLYILTFKLFESRGRWGGGMKDSEHKVEKHSLNLICC
jgi:hypothetical protein